MNIKNIRKDYKNLTLLERLSLADNAIARDDENELQAIVEASPRQYVTINDLHNPMQDIREFRLAYLIVRLGYIIQFDFFSAQTDLPSVANNPDSDLCERLLTNMKMVAYLYVRTTDAWKTVNDELGLRQEFKVQIPELKFFIELIKTKDEVMRLIAFTEDEIREVMKERIGDDKIKTLEDEIKDIRKELDLPTH